MSRAIPQPLIFGVENEANDSTAIVPHRRVARKRVFSDAPSVFPLRVQPRSSVVISEITGDGPVTPMAIDPTEPGYTRKRGRKSKVATPEVTTELRRSPRLNMYRGFKSHQISDAQKKRQRSSQG